MKERPATESPAFPEVAVSGAASPMRRQPARRKNPGGQVWARQFILLVPLATAAAGAAGVDMAQESAIYIQLLPTLFFVGALVVTVSMIHQRSLLQQNQELAERLDILHRLEVELNQSLDITQVARIVLAHAVESLGADAGALWLNPRFDIPHLPAQTGAPPDASSANDSLSATSVTCDEIDFPRGHNWHLTAARGWQEPERRSLLEGWNRAFDAGACEAPDLTGGGVGEAGQSLGRSGKSASRDATVCAEGAHCVGVRGVRGLRNCPSLESFMEPGDAAMTAAIRWKNEFIGAVTITRWNGTFGAAERVLLNDIALVAGPSLENALLYQTAAARADIDGLTGLLNHRAVRERLSGEMARAQRALHAGASATFSLVVMDLTDFKMFNDTYGHAVGDDVLRTVCDCLRQTFRASDIVARYGGDEFLVILPQTDGPGAEIICRRLIATLRARPFQAPDGSDVSIRLTCGVAVFPHDGQDVTSMFQAADARLYEAKQQGRDIVPGAALTQSAGSGKEEGTIGATDTTADLPVPVADGQAPIGASATRQLWKSFGVLDTLIAAVDNRDHYTRRHSEQVMRYAMLLAQELNVSAEMLEAVQICSLLHDVGKVAVPDAILRKPGLLNDDEMRLMKQHTSFGAMIVQNVPHQERVLEGVRSHHEAFDGSGYPDGLSGEEIPFMGRLLAVPVCFAAMTTDRPYRKLLSHERALQEIKNGRGTQFDPAIVDAFLRVMSKTEAAPNGAVPVTPQSTSAADRPLSAV